MDLLGENSWQTLITALNILINPICKNISRSFQCNKYLSLQLAWSECYIGIEEMEMEDAETTCLHDNT